MAVHCLPQDQAAKSQNVINLLKLTKQLYQKYNFGGEGEGWLFLKRGHSHKVVAHFQSTAKDASNQSNISSTAVVLNQEG